MKEPRQRLAKAEQEGRKGGRACIGDREKRRTGKGRGKGIRVVGGEKRRNRERKSGGGREEGRVAESKLWIGLRGPRVRVDSRWPGNPRGWKRITEAGDGSEEGGGGWMCGDLVSNHGTTGRAFIERAEARPSYPILSFTWSHVGAGGAGANQPNPTQRTLSPSPAPPRLNQPSSSPSSSSSFSDLLLLLRFHLFLLLILRLLRHPRLATHCYLPPYSLPPPPTASLVLLPPSFGPPNHPPSLPPGTTFSTSAHLHAPRSSLSVARTSYSVSSAIRAAYWSRPIPKNLNGRERWRTRSELLWILRYLNASRHLRILYSRGLWWFGGIRTWIFDEFGEDLLDLGMNLEFFFYTLLWVPLVAFGRC